MASNMKAVKLRMNSVRNTMQITRAMELVASSRLRRAKEIADNCRPYFEELYEALDTIARGNTDFSSVYVRPAACEKWCYVVIAGDRGLAGGYNANLFKRLEAEAAGKDYMVLPIGKKAVEYFKRRGKEILTDAFAEVAKVRVSDCFEIASLLCKEYKEGRIGHIALFYTKFHSMLSQEASSIPVIPLEDLNSPEEAASRDKVRDLILYEPEASEVFDAIVPEYLAGLTYGAVCESSVSELAARRMAMEAATNNAEEMIEKLSLQYNRARQSSITQEITEIVAGAEGV